MILLFSLLPLFGAVAMCKGQNDWHLKLEYIYPIRLSRLKPV